MSGGALPWWKWGVWLGACLRVGRMVGGSHGSSVEHRALVGPALLGGQLLGGFTLRKLRDNRPQMRGGNGCGYGGGWE